MFESFIGWIGESGVRNGLRKLDSLVYRSFHNVIVPGADGTTQIDHVVVSAFGVFVVETKNLRGWIFGTPNDQQWCQMIYGRRYHFQNPIHQNYRHLKCLEFFLGVQSETLKSVVFFVGDCKFKTAMPACVMTDGLRAHISGFQRPILTELEVAGVCQKLESLLNDRSLSKKTHLHSLRLRHTSKANCPKCSSPLKRRVAKKGRSVGQAFLGCSRYPRCQFTRTMPPQTPHHLSETPAVEPIQESIFAKIWRLLCR